MKDYFTLDGKIEENRRFLRETQDKYEKIRTYYPLFFFYLGFLGVYTFDIIQYVFSSPMDSVNFLLEILLFGHIILFSYVFYLFTKVLILKEVAIDLLPETVYVDYEKNKKSDDKKNAKEKNNELANQEKESYLMTLELSCKRNIKILLEKKKDLTNIIKFLIISFILYICLITIYKIDVMTKKKVVIPKAELIMNDGKVIVGTPLNGIVEDSSKEVLNDLPSISEMYYKVMKEIENEKKK